MLCLSTEGSGIPWDWLWVCGEGGYGIVPPFLEQQHQLKQHGVHVFGWCFYSIFFDLLHSSFLIIHFNHPHSLLPPLEFGCLTPVWKQILPRQQLRLLMLSSVTRFKEA